MGIKKLVMYVFVTKLWRETEDLARKTPELVSLGGSLGNLLLVIIKKLGVKREKQYEGEQ